MSKVKGLGIEDLIAGREYKCRDNLEDTYNLVYQGGNKMFNKDDREVLIIGSDVIQIIEEVKND